MCLPKELDTNAHAMFLLKKIKFESDQYLDLNADS